MSETLKFKYLFWFSFWVFTLSFSAMIFLLVYPIPDANREMASNAQGFLQGSLMMSAIGAVLTGNIASSLGKKKAEPGTPGTITVPEQEIETQKPKNEANE